MRITPYINFNKSTKEAFNYYSKVFNTPILNMDAYKNFPSEQPYSEVDGKLIMHARIKIGDSLLMGSDTPSFMEDGEYKLCGFSLSFEPDTREEADRVFKELSNDGKVTMPMCESSWKSYFGMCIDKYGINWMINVDNK